MVDPVRNKQHGNGDRNDNEVAKKDAQRHGEQERRRQREAKKRAPKESPR